MKKLAKTLNKIFNDEKFIEEMAKSGQNIHQMQHTMGKILTYYISTRDTQIHSYKELQELINKNYQPQNTKHKESTEDALIRNIINEGVVTHSFNGFNLSNIKKNGLGSEKNYDKELESELAKLENDLGISRYVEHQTNSTSEIYYTSPGANSIYYAMQQSPERLFNGPLKQDKNPLPAIVGEKKEDYYLRVAIDKINKNYRLEDQQHIIENARKVITKLCSHRPQIALIPINSKKFSLNSSLNNTHNNPTPLIEYINKQASGNMAQWATKTFFATCLGGIHESNCSDLVSTGVKVPASELEFVSIPDSFEIQQILAKQKGLVIGEKFDLFTLEKVDEKTLEEEQIEDKALNIEKTNQLELDKLKKEINQNSKKELLQPLKTQTENQKKHTLENQGRML